MTAIDWDRFAERVPAGTRVKKSSKSGFVVDGLLIENKPFRLMETARQEAPSFLFFHPFDSLTTTVSKPQSLQYLIDGTWLSYAQIMEG